MWQQIKQHRRAIGVGAIALVIVILLIIAGYSFDWTNFNGYNKVTIAHTISGPNVGTAIRTAEYQPGKGLWDWLQLLIIPLVIAVGGYVFNLTVSRNEQTAAKNRDQTERDIASDNQQEATLQEYINKMSELLLDKKLRESRPEDEVQKIARVRTLTVLPRLDKDRKKSVLQFLHESGLIHKDKPIIILYGANLYGANLSNTYLHAANLRGVNLHGANLDKADLNSAILSKADLHEATLYGTNLRDADLRDTNLCGAVGGFSGRYAHSDQVDLKDADLSGANLSEAGISPEQLDKAKSLKGATMPDGSKHL